MKYLDRYLTPNEQKILLFVLGLLVIGLALVIWHHHGQTVVVPAKPLEPPPLIDIRTAGATDLESLDGIGPGLAEKILSYRQEYGFQTTSDLKKVPGIGVALYDRIVGRLTEFGVDSVATKPGLLDINRASAEELETVPGLGPEMARRILVVRHAGYVFRKPQDLGRIKGFGAKTIAKIAPYFAWGNHD